MLTAELTPGRSLLNEPQQRLVHLGGVSPQQAVRRIGDLDVLGLRNGLVEAATSGIDRQTLPDWVYRNDDERIAGLTNCRSAGPKPLLNA